MTDTPTVDKLSQEQQVRLAALDQANSILPGYNVEYRIRVAAKFEDYIMKGVEEKHD